MGQPMWDIVGLPFLALRMGPERTVRALQGNVDPSFMPWLVAETGYLFAADKRHIVHVRTVEPSMEPCRRRILTLVLAGRGRYAASRHVALPPAPAPRLAITD